MPYMITLTPHFRGNSTLSFFVRTRHPSLWHHHLLDKFFIVIISYYHPLWSLLVLKYFIYLPVKFLFSFFFEINFAKLRYYFSVFPLKPNNHTTSYTPVLLVTFNQLINLRFICFFYFFCVFVKI